MAEQTLQEHLSANYDQDDYDDVLRDPGIQFPDLEAAEWTDHEIDEYFQLEKILASLNKLPRLYHDSADTGLQFSVKASRYFDADGTERTPTASTAQALTQSQTNYIYLTNAGVLTVNTSGFPAVTTPHVRICTIAAGATSWNPATNVVDYLSENLLRPLGTEEHQIVTRSWLPLTFTLADLAGSTTVEMSYGGLTEGIVAPKAGSLLALSIRGNADRTAGTVTAKPSINGVAVTPTDLNCVIDGTDVRQDYASTTFGTSGLTFTAGQRLGVSVTSASYTPAGSTDFSATLLIVLNAG